MRRKKGKKGDKGRAREREERVYETRSVQPARKR